MFKAKLVDLINKKNSLLCVGLDCDLKKIPRFLLKEADPLLTFNREIIEATASSAIAFKFNIAFYESLGVPGWKLLEKTLSFIPSDVLIIADAKRGDIENSSKKYAELYLGTYEFDAITVSPYMGFDSVKPFLEFGEACTFVLCLTSNPGAVDFQYYSFDGDPLYLKIARVVQEWNNLYDNCGLVVGATHPENLETIRDVAPQLPFLIPGIGTQGGNTRLTIQFGTDQSGGMALVNASRSILYASGESNFAEAAHEKAKLLTQEFNQYRRIKQHPK